MTRPTPLPAPAPTTCSSCLSRCTGPLPAKTDTHKKTPTQASASAFQVAGGRVAGICLRWLRRSASECAAPASLASQLLQRSAQTTVFSVGAGLPTDANTAQEQCAQQALGVSERWQYRTLVFLLDERFHFRAGQGFGQLLDWRRCPCCLDGRPGSSRKASRCLR